MSKPVPTAARPAASAMAIALAVLVVGSGVTRPAWADDHADNAPPETRQFPYAQTGKGCAAGAVLGSVVPGLGTAVGCVLGGFVAWWRA